MCICVKIEVSFLLTLCYKKLYRSMYMYVSCLCVNCCCPDFSHCFFHKFVTRCLRSQDNKEGKENKERRVGSVYRPEAACCTSLCGCSEWLGVGRESYDFILQSNICPSSIRCLVKHSFPGSFQIRKDRRVLRKRSGKLNATFVILKSKTDYNARNEADNHTERIDKHLDVHTDRETEKNNPVKKHASTSRTSILYSVEKDVSRHLLRRWSRTWIHHRSERLMSGSGLRPLKN
ncbi:hypothetical protein PUN28_019807 [Cardiocondyla obscurior]|uniref:Uncharacterized protein n=1 Tax=Cardiocondyla obscurior TaxID=286306 RepID=A0AAW2E8E7_9HYME